jgi:hypothetical protein
MPMSDYRCERYKRESLLIFQEVR